MGRLRLILIIGAIAVAAVGSWQVVNRLLNPMHSGPHPMLNRSPDGIAGIENGQQQKPIPVQLYFADMERSFLVAENRLLPRLKNPSEFGSLIINELIRGPAAEGIPTIPNSTTLRALYVAEGVAYVDLSGNIRRLHPGGSDSELFTLFSIVNTLTLNVPEIRTAKLLLDGEVSATLAGHIDIRHPFKANMLMVR